MAVPESIIRVLPGHEMAGLAGEAVEYMNDRLLIDTRDVKSDSRLALVILNAAGAITKGLLAIAEEIRRRG